MIKTVSSRKVLVYSARLTGLWGRKRATRTETYPLIEVSATDEPVTVGKLREIVHAMITAFKPKGDVALVVTETAQTIETQILDGIPYETRIFGLTDTRTVFRETLKKV